MGGSAPSEQQQASSVGEVDGFVLVGDARDEPGSSPSRPARTRGDKASQPAALRSPEATQPPSVSQAKPSGAASSASAKATATGQGGSGEMVRCCHGVALGLMEHAAYVPPRGGRWL